MKDWSFVLSVSSCLSVVLVKGMGIDFRAKTGLPGFLWHSLRKKSWGTLLFPIP